MNNCILTVLIAAYNHENYIRQTLNGVLNQETTYKFKIIISDDFSIDNTKAIIQEYIARYPDKIIPLFNSRNIGLNETLKKAIPLIDTKYTCILGGDDYWIDDYKIANEVDYLESHPNTSYVHTGYKCWLEDCESWGEYKNQWEWKMPKERDDRLISFLNHDFTYYPCTSTCCFITDVLIKCYRQNPQILDYTVGEGILVHAAMCMYGNTFHYIPDVTTVYRVRENSMSHYSDIGELLNYKMGYPKRKIITFQLFNIKYDKYKHVIKKDLDNLFILAYSRSAIGVYKKGIQEIGINDKLLKKYNLFCSNRFCTFLYYCFLKARGFLILFFKS